MKEFAKACLVFAVVATIAWADEVTEWNQILFQAAITAGSSPVVATREAAIVQAAVYDAVNGTTAGTRGSVSSPQAPQEHPSALPQYRPLTSVWLSCTQRRRTRSINGAPSHWRLLPLIRTLTAATRSRKGWIGARPWQMAYGTGEE